MRMILPMHAPAGRSGRQEARSGPRVRPWSDAERAQVDRLVRAHRPAGPCVAAFPGRSHRAVESHFARARQRIGIGAVRGRPRLATVLPLCEADEAAERSAAAAAAAAGARGSARLLARQLATGQYCAPARAAWLARHGGSQPAPCPPDEAIAGATG